MELALHIATEILQSIGAIIITGSSVAAVIDLTYAACKRQFNNRLEPVRLQLAQRLVLALEFLIGADILSSLHTPTLKDVALLVAIIGMRTVLSLSISYELRHPYSPPGTTKSIPPPREEGAS